MASRSGSGIEIADPSPSELGDAAHALAAAFVDDPVWTAIGPRSRRHRVLANRAAFWGIVRGSARHGARIRVVRERAGDGIAGATIAFADGAWPLPDSASLWELPWFLAAGPIPVLRGIRDDRTLRSVHIEHPHSYLWFLGVEPGRQGRGLGRALMADLHDWAAPAGLPVYLETGTRENVAFYAALGYVELGEILMPSGAVMWRMERPGTDVTLAA
jgi:GNAT superfamily N-acetyltransferase